ncbi:hypothetical protein LUI11_41040 [Bradyrhizobium diazoefficiens]|uniref:Uncharacterized protein n=1 Tax=Bradyrhizobium diazoefficiens TaxID=1355477 RepID=A0A809Z792_9BRAD|nr:MULTISPECIES: hypothetical protein [Bradyrhizobium]MCD9298816.1 hypothetical protein [Bradyrhizobium diazoefficiens]MCD9816075.1 hypothetical protein [Bradyrhizobium diazoefficiens]MCD9834011.1 hypothetical protein [Bradyrhizobium diazoefficiens]MCD9852776.1 hypothetical protein [Bradyrhizobium diazoefficiens]MCD9889107.1 hypothetical protein [Bradyrhizobium diazoefficiens]
MPIHDMGKAMLEHSDIQDSAGQEEQIADARGGEQAKGYMVAWVIDRADAGATR